jgi:hypothetical protein
VHVPPLDEEAADFVRRRDLRGPFRQGRGLLQEPSDRPHGVEAVIRDNTGNRQVLVGPREFTLFEGRSNPD